MPMSKLLLSFVVALIINSSSAYAGEGRLEVTRHSLSAPTSAEQSVASLANYLAPASYSPGDRAWAIFVWIGDRITYDIDAYLRGRYRDEKVTAEEVLMRRISVCDGFAALFSALARATGLEVATVQGYAKAYGVQEKTEFTTPNHAWNAVSISGSWHVIDPTWGAGYVFQDRYNKQLDSLYFLSKPEELKFTHWPVDAKWRQAIGIYLSKAQFEVQPRIDPGLFRAGVKGVDISAAIDEPGYRGLVTVFEQNHHGLKTQFIPLSQYLQAGRPYRIRILASEFEEIVVMNSGEAKPLYSADGIFDGEFRPSPGSVLIGGRPKNGSRLTGLFQYIAE